MQTFEVLWNGVKQGNSRPSVRGKETCLKHSVCLQWKVNVKMVSHEIRFSQFWLWLCFTFWALWELYYWFPAICFDCMQPCEQIIILVAYRTTCSLRNQSSALSSQAFPLVIASYSQCRYTLTETEKFEFTISCHPWGIFTCSMHRRPSGFLFFSDKRGYT